MSDSTTPANQGFTISGGSFSGSAFAAGTHATATTYVDSSTVATARRAVEELARQASDPALDATPAVAGARDDIADLRNELQGSPDPAKARDLLARLAAPLAEVAALAGSLASVREAVGKLLG